MSLEAAASYWRSSLLAGQSINRVRVRRLLELQGAERRGSAIMASIRATLEKYDLFTDPDFQSVWRETQVSVRLREGLIATPAAALEDPQVDIENHETHSGEVDPVDPALEVEAQAQMEPLVRGETLNSPEGDAGIVEAAAHVTVDPIARVSSIPASTQGIQSVLLTDHIKVATTKMMFHGYSQLAIMQGDREVRGVVSWQSIAERSMIEPPQLVADCRVDAQVVDADASLDDVAPIIANTGYVLVRAKDRKITGIVTATDLAREYGKNAYAFLCLRTIEVIIRGKLHPIVEQLDFLHLEEHSKARFHLDPALMTFGENVRLMQRDEVWERLCISVDKKQVLERLEEIRDIRNDVMHFDPEPLGDEKKRNLEQMENFLRRIFA